MESNLNEPISKMDKYDMLHTKRRWYKYITVEPTMFFYMMAFMVTNVIEQTFYVFRACTVDHGYSEEICYEINKHEEINNEVQVTTSIFHQWNGLASHIVPLLLAFFLGSYSDRRGRKFILLAGLIGKLYFSAMITLNTVKAWPLNYVIYTATFPSALTGADLAIFAACFAYIADVSSVKNRTLRVGILDVVYLSTLPTGVAIGNLLYNNVVNRSFTAMFAINTCLMVVATLHCLIFLEWQTSPAQKSLEETGVKNPIADFFDLKNIKRTFITLTKRRKENRRLFLWFLLISMAFYTFQRDERPVMYLYTSLVFQWDTSAFSHFRTYLSTAYVIVMLFGIPLMTKVFKWRDTTIIMFGAAAHISGHLFDAHATYDKLMYVGATAAALASCVTPLITHISGHLFYAHATYDKLMYVGATAAALGPCVATAHTIHDF
ncbi:hypothetical protein evm_008558 [Chilo suppressalis]|nr:hypothetical protein evm_008558 [Chilo suppressalis]